MRNPTAAMLVVGDEILSGRTREANFQHLAQELVAKGIDLCEVRIVADEEATIITAVNALRETYDHVFTSGGIGPTHDDITADAIATAFGVSLAVRDDARAILATHYADPENELNDARLRMARIPQAAILIGNPISKAPGFTIGNVHVLAGVPAIFQAMLAGLLPRLTGGEMLLTEEVEADRAEGEVALLLWGVAEAHPDVKIGCYPHSRGGVLGATVVLRSQDAGALAAAVAALRNELATAPAGAATGLGQHEASEH